MPEVITNHAFIAAIALLLHMLFATRRLYVGPKMTRIMHLPAASVQWFERKLNRSLRTPQARARRGLFLVLAYIFAALVKGIILAWLCSLFYFGAMAEILIVVISLSLRPAVDRALEVQRFLRAGDIESARSALAGSVWKNFSLMDEHTLARASIEKLLVDFSDKTFSPLFWYMIAGLPGMLVSWTITLLAEQLGGHRESFGSSAVKADYYFHWLPGRIAALTLALASVFVTFSRPHFAFIAATIPSISLPSRSCVIVTGAGALGLTLGGPMDVYLHSPDWVGTGRAQATPEDITRGLILVGVTTAVTLLVLLLLG